MTADLRALLAGIQTIAVVGLSPDPARPSSQVARFLAGRGYACVGVNPGIAGQTVHGIPVVARLAEVVPALDMPSSDMPTLDMPALDMVDIFRASDAVAGIVDEALALEPRPRVIWMQLGVIDEAAKAKAEAAGLTVVMNRCPKIVLGDR